MQTKITIRNEAQTCYIDIEGTIGIPEERQFGGDKSRVATYEKFRREVARISEVAATAVIVNIRSTGGDVNDALLIYEALRSLGARITTRCYGYTASAATVIAQAADEGCREISSNALYLIHNSECAVEGNAETLASRAELLHKTDVRLAQLYAQRSGRGEEFYAALMAENAFGAADYFSTVFELITNRSDVNMEDLTGTELEAAETELFRNAIADSIRMNLWLGDKGNEYGTGYTSFDGLLKLMTERIKDGSLHLSSNELTELLGEYSIKELFDKLIRGSSPV